MADRETLADEISRLAQLRTDGLLAEEEFKAAKARLFSDQRASDRPQEVRLPTSRQVVRLGIAVAFRAFLLLYVVLPFACVVLIGICLWLVRTLPA